MKAIHFRGGPLDGKKRRTEHLPPCYRVKELTKAGIKTTAYRLECERARNGRMIWVYVATASATMSY